MAEPIGTSAKLWLAMLKEGGRHTVDEAAALIGERDVASTGWMLTSMVQTTSVRKYPKVAGARVHYGVTAACKIPRGVTIGDVLACKLHQVEEA